MSKTRQVYKRTIYDILLNYFRKVSGKIDEEEAKYHKIGGLSVNELYRRYAKILKEKYKVKAPSKRLFIELLDEMVKEGVIQKIPYKNRKLIRFSAEMQLSEQIRAFFRAISLLIASKKQKIKNQNNPLKLFKELRDLERDIIEIWSMNFLLYKHGRSITVFKPNKKTKLRWISVEARPIPYEAYVKLTEALDVALSIMRKEFRKENEIVDKYFIKHKPSITEEELKIIKENFSKISDDLKGFRKDYERIKRSLERAFYQRSNAPGGI